MFEVITTVIANILTIVCCLITLYDKIKQQTKN